MITAHPAKIPASTHDLCAAAPPDVASAASSPITQSSALRLLCEAATKTSTDLLQGSRSSCPPDGLQTVIRTASSPISRAGNRAQRDSGNPWVISYSSGRTKTPVSARAIKMVIEINTVSRVCANNSGTQIPSHPTTRIVAANFLRVDKCRTIRPIYQMHLQLRLQRQHSQHQRPDLPDRRPQL